MPAGSRPFRPRLLPAGLALAMAVMGAGCSQVGDLGNLGPLAQSQEEPAPFPGQTDQHKAAETSGKKLSAAPRDAESAIAHARNLKTLGDKAGALAVLQQAATVHSNNRELASEYGRLALELDQVGLASKLLAMADDPARPDWRVLSARGTALAKESRYEEAIVFFQRAEALSPGNPTVVNNHAMALAATGDLPQAESRLRQARAARPSDTRLQTNLALVISLQGREAEAAEPASPVQRVSAPVMPARPVTVNVAAPAPRIAEPRAPEPRITAAPMPTPDTWSKVAVSEGQLPAPTPPGLSLPELPRIPVVPSVAGWSSQVSRN